MTEVNVPSPDDAAAYRYHEILFGGMPAAFGIDDPPMLGMYFNGSTAYIAATRDKTALTPHTRVELWPSDDQINDLITVLEYYRNLKKTAGKWEGKTDE